MGFGNHVSMTPKSTFTGNEWAALDSLPTSVRRALHEAVTDVCPLWARNKFAKYQRDFGKEAEAMMAKHFEFGNDAEVRNFSAWHRRSYGQDTPHVRAIATIQRYGGRKFPVDANVRARKYQRTGKEGHDP